MFLKSAHIGLNHWWRYLLSIPLLFLGALIGQIPLLIAAGIAMNQRGISAEEMDVALAAMDFGAMGLDQNLGLALVLLAFVGALGALWFCVKYLHRKPFQILITPFTRIDWGKIGYAFGLWTLLALVGELIAWRLAPESYTMQFEAGRFLGLMLVSLCLIPLQTSCEELIFRGYMMQGISLLSRWRWVPLLITSLAFGLLHFANPEVQKFGMAPAMMYYVGTGLFLGILTLMDDGLELALGIHAATNIFASLFVTFDESVLQTAALFRSSEVNFPLMLAYFVVAACVFTWLVARKYGWRDWSKCYGPLERPDEDAIAKE